MSSDLWILQGDWRDETQFEPDTFGIATGTINMARYSRRAESFGKIVGWLFSPTVWKIILIFFVLRVLIEAWPVFLIGLVVYAIYLFAKSSTTPKLDADTTNQVQAASEKEFFNPPAFPRSADGLGVFHIGDDGTVTDTRSGLMWMRCVEGQTWNGQSSVRNYAPAKYTWNQAMQLRRDYSGYDDWRLPTIEELKAVITAFDTDVFPDSLMNPVPEYWSSPLDQNDIRWPLSISIAGTFRGYTEHAYRVRLVRNVQTPDKLMAAD